MHPYPSAAERSATMAPFDPQWSAAQARASRKARTPVPSPGAARVRARAQSGGPLLARAWSALLSGLVIMVMAQVVVQPVAVFVGACGSEDMAVPGEFGYQTWLYLSTAVLLSSSAFLLGVCSSGIDPSSPGD